MFFNNMFILASSSSSRYKILKNNKLSFLKTKPICNEEFLKKKLTKKKVSVKRISLELARLKSESISIKNPHNLVVGCDTMISLNGSALNKAKNLKEAKKKIKNISGKQHNIFSSASVYYNKKEIWKVTQKSTVKIRVLTSLEIDNYIKSSNRSILDSVGCYQVELAGPSIIENIRGDLFNVMGFPLFPFLKFLKEYKIPEK